MRAVAELLLIAVAVAVAAGILMGPLAALLSGAIFLAAVGILIVMSKMGALPQNSRPKKPTRFCRECGAEIARESKFCEECGDKASV